MFRINKDSQRSASSRDKRWSRSAHQFRPTPLECFESRVVPSTTSGSAVTATLVEVDTQKDEVCFKLVNPTNQIATIVLADYAYNGQANFHNQHLVDGTVVTLLPGETKQEVCVKFECNENNQTDIEQVDLSKVVAHGGNVVESNPFNYTPASGYTGVQTVVGPEFSSVVSSNGAGFVLLNPINCQEEDCTGGISFGSGNGNGNLDGNGNHVVIGSNDGNFNGTGLFSLGSGNANGNLDGNGNTVAIGDLNGNANGTGGVSVGSGNVNGNANGNGNTVVIGSNDGNGNGSGLISVDSGNGNGNGDGNGNTVVIGSGNGNNNG